MGCVNKPAPLLCVSFKKRGQSMKKASLFLSISCIVILAGCSQGESTPKVEFTSWNTCSSLTTLKDFVTTTSKKGTADYIPVEDRVAVFDMDGTLYGELFPTYLEYVMYEYRVLDDPAYKDKASAEEVTFAREIRDNGVRNNAYPSGTDLRHATLAAKAYAGMTLKEFDEYATTFLKKEIPCFNNMTYGSAFYEPMKEVVNYLKENDYRVYVVSGSDRFLCRALVPNALGIPKDHIIGMDVRVEATNQGDTDGLNYQYTVGDELLRTDELIIKNLKFNKVTNIIKEIGQQPVLSFGNSGGDQSMHLYTITENHYKAEAFMLVADDLVRDYSYLSEEKIAGLNKQWSDLGFNVVSMKNDFKTIYASNVTKKAA